MKTILSLSLMALVLMATFTNCEKGQQGPAGKDGTNGANGSANITSRTYTLTTWTSGSSFWYSTLSTPELTSGNINNAAILVYVSDTQNTWVPVPATIVNSTNYFWNYAATIGSVELRWEYNGIGNGSNPNTYYSTTVKAKVVVIPSARVIQNPNLNLKDYEAVKKAFDLRD